MGSGQVRPLDGLEEYLSIRRSRYAATTLRNEGFVLRRFVSHVGNIQVRHLRPEHVADWFYGRNGFCGPHTTRDRVHREPVTASTHNFYRTRLASFFRFCTTRGWTRQDLLRDVEPMRLPTVKRLQPAPADLLAMLEATGNGRDRAYIATAINSGLRANEMLRIRVGDVDLPAATTAVTISKSAEEDSFPITSDLDPELRRWLVVYQDDLDRPLHPDDHLFPARSAGVYEWHHAEDGSKMRTRSAPIWIPTRPMGHAERVVQQALAALGLPTKHQGTHTIRRAAARHFFDSMSSDVGYDAALRTVSAMLHHKSSATTEQYLGLSSERKRRDDRLRGRPFLSALVSTENVVPLRRTAGGG
ncbi:MAG: tyrosine-type recombinase/integrase [Euzebyaceae bacterium]|nr:tyrosine-type recombinase/integrase [Euzebyaceae bacterium]